MTKISFISSNSSFTECVRTTITQNLVHHSISITSNAGCASPSYEGCTFDDTNTKQNPLSSSASFAQCTFIKLTANVNGGAISFTSDSPHTVRECFFRECSTGTHSNYQSGGGAVCSSAGSLSVFSSRFIQCSSAGYGGAVLGTSSCTLTVLFESIVIGCSCNRCGGGASTHFSSVADVSSCRFISCQSTRYGGGYYHNNEAGLSVRVSNSLFLKNVAKLNDNNRGGGGFEDCRYSTYSSKHHFLFFRENTAATNKGNDLSICNISLTAADIIHCFTTTQTHSFWNKNKHQDDWLPQANINAKLTATISGYRYSPLHSRGNINTDYI